MNPAARQAIPETSNTTPGDSYTRLVQLAELDLQLSLAAAASGQAIELVFPKGLVQLLPVVTDFEPQAPR